GGTSGAMLSRPVLGPVAIPGLPRAAKACQPAPPPGPPGMRRFPEPARRFWFALTRAPPSGTNRRSIPGGGPEVGTFTAGGPREAGSEQRSPANPNEENRTVKRTVGIAVGVATLGLAVYLGSHLWAQTAAPAGHPGSASPKTRIALLNLKYVVMNYGKW